MGIINRFKNFMGRTITVSKYKLITDEGDGFYAWNGNLYQSDIIRAGIDLGATTDLTCATIIFRVPDDEILYVKQMYWLPSDLLDERIREEFCM